MPRTREEERLYRRQWRARKREQAAAGATILTMPTPKPSTEVADAIKQELAGLAASAHYPGIAQAALAMARIMDDSRASAHHASAARSLDGLLSRLHDASKGSRGGKLLRKREARREE
jgi:hypothetical protein